jgi:Uma2 family endonuclease
MIETSTVREIRSQVMPLVVKFRPLYDMTPNEFYEFCRLNPDIPVELTAEGEIVFMSPSGGNTGARNANVVIALGLWSNEDGRGVIYDSSTGFILPNNAVRSPDASWVHRDRLAAFAPEELERFLPLCPDFVVEIASPSDRSIDLQAKMDEYIANGAQLGWLILPDARSVWVYRPGGTPILLSEIDTLSGEPTLPGFTLDLRPIWKPSSRGKRP